uniref:N-terminal Ras-GEF domain-containing protein n=1 Tax=Terrapene triunguis TaxID=2587831 RepID=A0A674IW92_9SAUR
SVPRLGPAPCCLLRLQLRISLSLQPLTPLCPSPPIQLRALSLPGPWLRSQAGSGFPPSPAQRAQPGPGAQQGAGARGAKGPSHPQPGTQPPVTLTEEAEEGVIYTVTTRQSGGAQPGAPGGAGSQARSLKAGSLVRLVRHLLEAQTLGDAAYVPAFLVTYRVFTRPPTVLGLLLDRLEEVGALELRPVSPETAELQRAFSSVMCSWLDGYPEDFGGALDPGLVERLGRSLQCALGQGSEAERRLLALRGVPGGPSNGGEGGW